MNLHRLFQLCLLSFFFLAGCENDYLPKIRIHLPWDKPLVTETNTPQNQNVTVEPQQSPLAPEETIIPARVEQEPIFFPELTRISISNEINLVPSPSQSYIYLPLQPIKLGEIVQLVASDPNGAWLLVLHKNTLGWLSSIYIGFGSGTLDASVLYNKSEEPCGGYLGSLTSISQDWISNIQGSVQIKGVAYTPRNYVKSDKWSVGLSENGKVIDFNVISSDLEEGGQIDEFYGQVDNLVIGEKISLLNESIESSSFPFQVSFYNTECSSSIVMEPEGSSGNESFGPTKAPTIRVITIEVISTSEWKNPPDPWTNDSNEIPYCKGAAKVQLITDEDAEVCTKNDRVNMREGPGIQYDILTQQAPRTVVWVLAGPVCSNNAYWWKVRNGSGLIGWMMEGGDKNDPYYLCPN